MRLENCRTRLAASAAGPPTTARRAALKQNGQNCRQVALGNVLHLGREPTKDELRAAAQLQLQWDGVAADMALARVQTQDLQWTWYGDGGTCLMTQLIEHKLPDCVAVLVHRGEHARMAKALGYDDIAQTVLEDAASPGCIYFSRSHCMSCVQDRTQPPAATGRWKNAGQSSFKDVTRAGLRRIINGAQWCVLVWSLAHAEARLKPNVRAGLHSSQLVLAARVALRLGYVPHVHQAAYYREIRRRPVEVWGAPALQTFQDMLVEWWNRV